MPLHEHDHDYTIEVDRSSRAGMKSLVKPRRCTFILIVAVLVSGCAKGIVTSQIESSIAERLPEIIGPARSYRVEVSGHTTQMIKGKMSQVRILGEVVSIAPNLAVDELEVTLDDIVFDRHTQAIKSCKATLFTAKVAERTLNAYLSAERPDLNELRVRLRRGRMLVHVRPAFLKLSVGVDLEGTLKVVAPAKVFFEVDRLKLAGLKMPGLTAEYIEEKINPVQDFSSSGLGIRLTSIEISPGALVMKGSAELDQRIR